MRKAHLLGAIVSSSFGFLLQIAPIYGDVTTEGQVSPSPLCNPCVGDIGPTLLQVGLLTDGVVTVTDDSGPTNLITVPLTYIGENAEGTLNCAAPADEENFQTFLPPGERTHAGNRRHRHRSGAGTAAGGEHGRAGRCGQRRAGCGIPRVFSGHRRPIVLGLMGASAGRVG